MICANPEGAFRSIDDGLTWAPAVSGMDNTFVLSLTQDTLGRLYAGTYGGVFRSSDNGQSWTPINDPDLALRGVYNVHFTESGIIAAGTSLGIFLSEDDGATWMFQEGETGGMRITSFISAGETIVAGSHGYAVFVGEFVCGDANSDGAANVGDAVFLIGYIFSGGPAPNPESAGDANGDGAVNVGDAVYLINYIFSGGPEPNCP
jgi:photosystem II stability/assembly factor-like uncharacterized protein